MNGLFLPSGYYEYAAMNICIHKFEDGFYFHHNILSWHVLVVSSVTLGKGLEIFQSRNKSYITKWAALEQGGQDAWVIFSLCTCWMTLTDEWLSFSGDEGMQWQFLFWASLLPETASGKMSCFLRKQGTAFLDYYKVSVLFVWLMNPHFKCSHLMYLSLLTTLPFMCCWRFLRFMRPNPQAMCVWIKGTWESLFMSDPKKFPLSCLSEVHAASVLGRWSLLSCGRIWNLLLFYFNWSENRLTDP